MRRFAAERNSPLTGRCASNGYAEVERRSSLVPRSNSLLPVLPALHDL